MYGSCTALRLEEPPDLSLPPLPAAAAFEPSDRGHRTALARRDEPAAETIFIAKLFKCLSKGQAWVAGVKLFNGVTHSLKIALLLSERA